MIVALAGAVAMAIALPHLPGLRRVAPPVAIALWLGALGLRAATGIAVVVLVANYLPASGALAILTHWCWRTVVPLLSAHLGLSGNEVGHAAAILPAVLVTMSFLSSAWAVLRAAGAVRRVLRRRVLGAGPMGSLIVGGAGVRIAAAGLARPKVIVSAGALVHLDDAELAASLAHERGHIARRHRFALLWGQLCQALGRPLPGGGRALAELAFHVERDADAYAIAHAHDRGALAGAICKAASTDLSAGTWRTSGARRSVADRVRLLTDGAPGRRGPVERSLTFGAMAAACLILMLAAAVPGVAATAGAASRTAPAAPRCSS